MQMPTIFDNIEVKLLPALVEGIKSARRSDFCAGLLQSSGLETAGGRCSEVRAQSQMQVRSLQSGSTDGNFKPVDRGSEAVGSQRRGK
jgi:hypothetical protein